MGWMDRVFIEQGDAVHFCPEWGETYTWGIDVCPECGAKLRRSAKLERHLARRESAVYQMYDEPTSVELETGKGER